MDILEFDYTQNHIQQTSTVCAHCSEFILRSQSTTTKICAAQGFIRCEGIRKVPFDLKVAVSQLAMHMHGEKHRIEVQSMCRECSVLESELLSYVGNQARRIVQECVIIAVSLLLYRKIHQPH